MFRFVDHMSKLFFSKFLFEGTVFSTFLETTFFLDFSKFVQFKVSVDVVAYHESYFDFELFDDEDEALLGHDSEF